MAEKPRNIQEDETKFDLRPVSSKQTVRPRKTWYSVFLIALVAVLLIVLSQHISKLQGEQKNLRQQIQAVAAEMRELQEKIQIEARARELFAQAETLAVEGKKLELKLSLDKLQELGQTDTLTAHHKQVEELIRRAEGWPATEEDIVFIWRREDGVANLKPRGRAHIDENGNLACTGGGFLVDSVNTLLFKRCTASHELTIETLMQSESSAQSGPSRTITFSTDGSSRNFTLGMDGDSIIVRLKTSITGTATNGHELTVGKVPINSMSHVVVTYSSGLLRYYLNGEKLFETEKVQGDFSNWEPTHHFLLGDEYATPRDWIGRLGGVAIYDRALNPEEVMMNFEASGVR
ncbi:MAG: hypothetical protein O3B01_27175 [Planctomycetota bacterium]|nr:hypothetical protein [Planctomycetota bacterium]